MKREEINLPNSAGMIRLSRVQGDVNLYAAASTVPGCIRITLSEAEESRSLSETWRFEGKQIAVIEMTYTQFAEMITNIGSIATPCTIRRMQGEPTEPVELPYEREIYDEEIRQSVLDSVKAIDAAIAAIDEQNITKKAKTALKEPLQLAKREILDSIPFIVKQFAERMDQVLSETKIEFNAYVEQMVIDRGLEGLQNDLKLLRDSDRPKLEN